MKDKKINFLAIGLFAANLMILLLLALWTSQSTALKNQNEMLSKINRTISQGIKTQAAPASMPDKQCHNLATKKDNALKNSLNLLSKCEEEGDPNWPNCKKKINPCTSQPDTWSYYRSESGGVTNLRTVYGNGDATGYLGLTQYWVCQDGKAKVLQRIYYPYMGLGWGFYENFPFDDDPSTVSRKEKEICNTFDL